MASSAFSRARVHIHAEQKRNQGRHRRSNIERTVREKKRMNVRKKKKHHVSLSFVHAERRTTGGDLFLCLFLSEHLLHLDRE